jgi:hypothetical protein
MYLAKLKVAPPYVDLDLTQESEPLHSSLQEFKDKLAGDQTVLARMQNKVKVCPACGKPCAYLSANCNSCGFSIADTQVSHTDNVFMGFIYGIGAGKFPFKISIRKQTPELLVFDDPLQVSMLHLNCIPTKVYIPDLRYLFANPARGLGLINSMFEAAGEACLNTFWKSEPFRKRFFGNVPVPKSAEELLESGVLGAGMNFPPSQYQMHLQFIHAPLLPHHYQAMLEGNHFHRGRFFPFQYLRLALAKGDAVKTAVTEDTDIEMLVGKISAAGVHYEEVRQDMLRGLQESQARLSAWKEDEFEMQVINGKAFTADGGLRQGVDVQALKKEDLSLMQNYGRPFKDGKPSGTYYKYAKQPHEVESFS